VNMSQKQEMRVRAPLQSEHIVVKHPHGIEDLLRLPAPVSIWGYK